MADPTVGSSASSPPVGESFASRRNQAAGRTRQHLQLVRHRSSNLPISLTGFVGREHEIAEVTRLLERARLLTITGAGGSGKTRLALELGGRLAEAFADGVEWTELASLADSALVPQAVATALNVRQQPGLSLTATLAEYLRSRRLLLVLDNCEHMVAACAELADTLLRSCPGLRILATSREALGIAGEIAWLAPPLSLPDPGASLDALLQAEAVQFFLERATATLPTFRLTEQNGPAVARVCQRLDGLPLAIELAAARVKVLAPEQIASRLDDCFRLLTLGSRTAVPRQQTLRAAIDWSYDLLAERERILFGRLSVFAGGFTLDAAEAVCTGEGIAPRDVLDLLTHLVDKSLVAVRENVGEGRYRLLETVRQYAAERLEETAAGETVRERHAAHFLALAEAAEPELLGAQQGTWMDRLETEHDNLRAALSWLLGRGQGTRAARLGSAIYRFWQTRGYLGEGRRWLEQALTIPSAPPSSEGSATEWRVARAKALKGAGVLAWAQGDYDRSTELFEAGLALFRELQDEDGVAGLLNNLGVIALHHADYARANELFEASLALRRKQGNAWGIATALNNLGATAGKQGDPDRARRYYEESLALQRSMGNTHGVAVCLSNLAAVAYSQDEYARAQLLYEESLTLRRHLGDKAGVADSLGKLGAVSLRQGHTQAARALYAESLPLLRELGDKERIAMELVGIAGLALVLKQPVRAVQLLGAAHAIRAAIGAPLTPHERAEQEEHVSAAHGVLDEVIFAAAWAEGRALSLEPALDLAAEALRSPTAPPPAPETPPALHLKAVVPPPGAAVPSTAEVRILALGPLEIWRGDHLIPPAEWGSAKPRELLFYLLGHPGGRTKEQIGLALWPDASPGQLRNSFHFTLHHLRRALGRAEWIVFENDRYRFDRSLPHRYDVDTFEAHLARAEQFRRSEPPALAEAVEALEAGVQLYRGDFLEETFFGEWYRERQDELRRRYVDALSSLADLLFATDRYAEAAEAYRRTLARENLLESAHRGLMRCLARQGERERALKHYPILMALLRAELDTEPDAETTALYVCIRRGEEV